MARSQRRRRLRLACVGAKTAIAALVASAISVSIAEAATCLASAEEVRKATPNAWPKWTFGPNRERCWYAGKKPIFEKPPRTQAEMQPAPAPQTKVDAASEAERRTAESAKRAWALEHRWSHSFEIRHQARDESFAPWVGDPNDDPPLGSRLLPLSQ
jgi:hypothetical protein